MFTGLIETSSRVLDLAQLPTGMTRLLLARPQHFGDDLKTGDSLAVNGVCLTLVSSSQEAEMAFDVGGKTLQDTTLGKLTQGAFVHLERAARLSDRMGGHLVSGHIDLVVPVVSVTEDEGKGWWLEIEVDRKHRSLLVPKGSIAIDGVSLTIQQLRDSSESTFVSIMLIPETLRKTTFQQIKKGSFVNLEFDMIAKYVERQLQTGLSKNSELDSLFKDRG